MAMGSTLMASHWVTLPKPDVQDQHLTQALGNLRNPADPPGWMAVHVLYTECTCSRRIFDHLFDSKRPTQVRETVLLVGDDREYESRARAAGFAVEVIAPHQLKERFHIESAPLLMVLDDSNAVRYSGGYTERKQGPEIRDRAIIERVVGEGAITELPLYGCGVSEELQGMLDPFGLKY